MTLYLIANIITCICAFIGFIYGIVGFFKPKKAVYAQMITLAVGCVAFGRLYQVVRLLTGGNILDEFQLGILGVIGSLMFFFSANFGAMDSLADDGSKQFLKYRLISLAAPVTLAVIYLVFILFGEASVLAKITGAVITVFAMQASYYNLKHLIFPDVDFGVIRCLKTYNLLALLYSLACVAEAVAISRSSETAMFIICIITGLIVINIVPTAARGMKKWTI